MFQRGGPPLSTDLCPTCYTAQAKVEPKVLQTERNSDPRTCLQDRMPLAEGNPFLEGVHELPAEGGKLIDTESQPRIDPVDVVLPDTPPPVVPRKSSRRQSAAKKTIGVDCLPHNHIASQMMQQCSRSSTALTLMIPQFKRSSVDLVFSSPPVATHDAQPTITPAGAEKVILSIFQHMDHFNDLFAAALVNQGFYRVFKRHELDLIKSTLRKMSPPAWEFREIAFPGHDHLHAEDLETTRPEEEYNPASYLKLQKRDIQVIRAIKSEILEKCQSFVRPEISAALVSACPAESARVDDALWRIWTFCKIFGSGKGREEDIVAQMDWLNGGMLVHQATCTFSIMSTDFMSDTLIGAPECFGQGNVGGLAAEQLFDMMELWTCFSVLLQNFEGRTVQARQAGIYDNTDIRGGDIDGEEMMLNEWIYYLLTFGLDTVVRLTGPYHPSDPRAFTIAAEKGWVNWKPPVLDGTRQHFLKEAARRVYEDKIAHKYAKISIRDVQRQQSKIRIQKHIHDLQHRKKSGEPRPMIRMSQERPMSEWDTVIRNLTRPPPPPQGPGNEIITHVPALRSASAEEVATSVPLPASRSTSSRTSSPPRRTVALPLLPTPPPSTVPSNHDRRSVTSDLPSIEEQPPLPPRRTVAQPLLPSPSASTVQSNRDLYTMGSVSSVGSPPRRMFAQPLLPTPSPTTVPSNRDWYRYSTGTSMPSILEDPLHHPLSEPPGPPHPAFRPHPMSLPYSERHMRQGSQSSGSFSSRSEALQQHEQQHHIFGSRSHENTADKAIYRIVEMGFTADQAREALRLTDLGDGLRVDRAVEFLLSRQA
ncbi:unnamed protein product [Alternaria alternata]